MAFVHHVLSLNTVSFLTLFAVLRPGKPLLVLPACTAFDKTVLYVYLLLGLHTVKIHLLVCGNTMGVHNDLVRRVGVPTLEVGVEECQIILVFCPVWSRAGTDIDAALSKVPGKTHTHIYCT